MANKTCGECKYYKPYNEKICLYVHRTCVSPETRACSSFAKLTNGDKIFQGGNRALAEFHGKLACDVCAYRYDHRCIAPQGKPLTCVDGIEEWLNAPAESGEVNEYLCNRDGRK